WLERQRRDPFVKNARIKSYRCRSAFKLLQINNSMLEGGLIRPGDTVVDCGASPGSWTQVAVDLSSPGGTVLSLDIQDFEPIEGAICLPKTDIRQTAEVTRIIKEKLGCARGVDVVLSDIAPTATGIPDLDHPNLINLAQRVLQLALHISRPGASLLIKLWSCPEVDDFKRLLERIYLGPSTNSRGSGTWDKSPAVRILKPKASRQESAEIYVCARGFCFAPNK
uniref:rRNA methyltransferase 2, mitochondrial n=1 Tax=Mesocestoides corti TaxID=53468 RepID=A0A5K3F1X1_MESCO